MNRHTRTRLRNRFIHPVLGLFESLWLAVKDAFKAIDDARKTDLFRP